jgi:hypothetical protein
VPAWTPEYAASIKIAFYDFLGNVWVKSKDRGYMILGTNLLNSQVRVIEAVFDALGRDVHDIKILKSRQLGVSTICRALTLFWNGIFDMTSALVFDTGPHLEEARLELLDMLEKFPSTFAFPRKKRDNRFSLTLETGSRINLLAAGASKTKASGGLGSGSGISMTHRSELCGYGDPEALENFRHTMARNNPNRLFIDESTARGFNLWHEIWCEAKKDPDCVTVFIGWWAHQFQIIPREHPDFEKYTEAPLTAEEKEKIAEVKTRYGHEISAEQLAWIRKEMNPGLDDDSDEVGGSDDPVRLQNQPWTEDDAFQQTGSTFFPSEVLTRQTKECVIDKYEGYAFSPGFDFIDMQVHRVKHYRQVELKVWEPPVEDAVYVVAADPAFGHSEESDRSAIQVLRAYSDGLDQVAEYAWPLLNTSQFAWVIAAIEGWYAGHTSQVYRILELNGPGTPVFQELQSLKQKIATGYFGSVLSDRGLESIQANVRNYMYTRIDSLHAGQALHFKTTSALKVQIMERLRDMTSNGVLRVRSIATIEEMRSVIREGDSIGATGRKKDDRVMSLAMAVHQWEARARRPLMSGRRTRDAERAKRQLSLTDQVRLYNSSQFQTFLAGKERIRKDRVMAQLRERRWGGRG